MRGGSMAWESDKDWKDPNDSKTAAFSVSAILRSEVTRKIDSVTSLLKIKPKLYGWE
jgi:hypothetical protein